MSGDIFTSIGSDRGTKKLLKDWSKIKVFWDVATAGSLSAAAQRAGVTQSCLSRHIATFEKIMGARLFDRYVGGLRLLPIGEKIFVEAKKIVQAVKDLEAMLMKHAKNSVINITDIDKLRIFYDVAVNGSLSKTSLIARISQSGLSRHIGKLEKMVGDVPLFMRHVKGLALNEIGIEVLKFVSIIRQHVGVIEDYII